MGGDLGVEWFDWCWCIVGLGNVYVGLWIDCDVWFGLCVNIGYCFVCIVEWKMWY